MAALVAGLCAAAAARRLSWAVAPIGVDARMLAKAVGQADRERIQELGAAMQGVTGLEWEQELWCSLDCVDPGERDGLLSELVLELEWRTSRWGRVPRVCASISMSTGFLVGSMALVEAIGNPLTDPWAVVTPALDAVAVSLAGALFCVAVHVRFARGGARGADGRERPRDASAGARRVRERIRGDGGDDKIEPGWVRSSPLHGRSSPVVACDG